MIVPLLVVLCASVEVTPVQKVIAMMQEMKQKAEAEQHAEAKQHSAYMEWCEDTSVTKKYAIKNAAAAIEKATATIEKHTAAANALSDEIAELDGEMAGWKAELDKATAARDKEHADFKVLSADYAESLDALANAISVLKSRSADVPQAELLLQQAAATAPSARRALTAFLQSKKSSQPGGYVQPEADAYEFQSHGIIDTLEGLLDKFREEANQVEKDEMNAKHAYDMMALSLNDSINAASARASKLQGEASGHRETAAEAQTQLTTQQASKAEDEKYLQDLVAQCDQKQMDFKSRQQLRSEEMDALQQAIDIISSKSVAGKADKHLPSLLQKKASFAQFLGHSAAQDILQSRAAYLLSQKGQELQSKELVLLATKVTQDPFEKVTDMIRALITKLEEEAAAEADHKAWCDGELKTNKLTRDEKSQQVDELSASVDSLQAHIAKLTDEQAELAQQVAELDAAMAEATEMRTAEKAKNTETLADAREAIEAVKQAQSILKEFYAKAATATALTQQTPAEDAPASFDSAYTGQQSSSKGVLGMLEVIGADFARLEADTESAESSAQREYDTFAEESAADKAAKVADGKAKKKLQAQKERELAAAQDDLRAVREELDAALKYYDELKPACLEANVSYGDRTARREEEIASLNEAYKILSGDA